MINIITDKQLENNSVTTDTSIKNKLEKDEDLKDLSKRFFEVKKRMYLKDIEKRKKQVDDLRKTIEDLKIEIKDLNKEIEYINGKIKYTESEIENESINLLVDQNDVRKLLEFYEALIEIEDILRQKGKKEDDSDEFMTFDYFFDFCDIRNVDPLELMDRLDPELTEKINQSKQ